MVPAAKARLATPQGSPRGQGMTRRADWYFLQQQLGEMNPEESTFGQHPTLLGAQPENPEHEQFNSAWEDAEEDSLAASTLDAELNASTGEETDASGCPAQTPSAEQYCRRNHAMCRECTRAWRELRRPKNRHLSFPLFWETTKEDAISYWDSCSEIEDALEHGHDAAKVKEGMFASLEGVAWDNAKMIDENGDLHVTHILDGLDSLYGVSMTFQSLSAALCGLQQRQMESARTYYNRMVQITVILRERHGNHYRPGELARMSKDCFYVGFYPRTAPWWYIWKTNPIPPPWIYWRPCWSKRKTIPWRVPGIHCPRHLGQASPRNQWSVTTDSCWPRKGMRGTLSTLLNWMPTLPRRRLRSTLHHWMTHWMPSRHGIMMGSSLASIRLLRLTNSNTGTASIAGKRGHHWHQCKERSPFPRAPGSVWPTG